MALDQQEQPTTAAEITAQLLAEAEQARTLTRQAKRDYSLELGMWDNDFPANEEGF